MDLTDSEIIVDVAIRDDIKGPAKIVCWCGIEIGFVRPLVSPRHFDAETRKKHKGKWFDPNWPHGFYATPEEAACDLVREYVKRNPESEVTRAALRKDYDFIREYRRNLVDGIETFDD